MRYLVDLTRNIDPLSMPELSNLRFAALMGSLNFALDNNISYSASSLVQERLVSGFSEAHNSQYNVLGGVYEYALKDGGYLYLNFIVGRGSDLNMYAMDNLVQAATYSDFGWEFGKSIVLDLLGPIGMGINYILMFTGLDEAAPPLGVAVNAALRGGYAGSPVFIFVPIKISYSKTKRA